MAKLGLQFHASRAEVAEFVAQSVNELGLWLAFETLGPLDMRPEAPFGLRTHNRGGLTVLLGAETTDRLGESVSQATTDDADALRVWRKPRKALASRLRKGVRVVNTETGSTVA